MQTNRSDNSVAIILRIFGFIILIAGAIAFIVVLVSKEPFLTGLLYFGIGAFTSALVFAASEALHMLQNLTDKVYELEDKIKSDED